MPARAAAMAYRLVMTITDGIRRATPKRLTGAEEELGEDAEKMAPGWSADQLRGVLGDDVLAELMAGAVWPVMSRQLVGLQQAGVDLGTFLPQMGRMTAGVHQAVVANAARTKAEGTDRWADLLRTTMPEGLVRDAILASPAWPDIAAAMAGLDAKGVDVARILLDAHAAGAGVDQAVAAVITAAATTAPAPAPAAPSAPAPADARVPAPAPVPGAAPTAVPAAGVAPVAAAAAPVREAADPWAPPASTDAKRSWGPLTEGLSVPRDLDLCDRAKALEQLGVNRLGHATIVGLVKDVLPDQEVGLLIGSRQGAPAGPPDGPGPRPGRPRTPRRTPGPPRDRHLLEGGPVVHGGGPSRGRAPVLPDDAALRAVRARVPREGFPGGGPFPLHHNRSRGPRTAGPGRAGVPAHRRVTAPARAAGHRR
ncbi:hypothetical protein [Streptomyces sp. H27-S2]|uniref:hypothetical protein n=1 Tax=Streptomyces antarcticus TaxID=2996458 RepID=UPI002271FD5D|nr:hypothetical protein [Streptomyces sp. H27-S2]MCY0950627.1 hypothetical protein [Streptomyces sp. H27-S2]